MEKEIRHIRMAVDRMHRLMEELVALQKQRHQNRRVVNLPQRDADRTLKDHYDEEELMTIKEAIDHIPVSRTKLYEMRREGSLHTIERSSREKRLIRTEVEAARQWSRNKGKW